MNIQNAIQTEISTLETRLSALRAVAQYYEEKPKAGGGQPKPVQKQPRKKQWNKDKEMELIRMVHDGVSYKRIAKTIGHTVSACRQRFGLISGKYTNPDCKLHVRLKDGVVVAA